MLINLIIFLDVYTAITGHSTDKDRVSTSYIMLDNDLKLGIALRLELEIRPRMKVSRKCSYFYYFKI